MAHCAKLELLLGSFELSERYDFLSQHGMKIRICSPKLLACLHTKLQALEDCDETDVLVLKNQVEAKTSSIVPNAPSDFVTQCSTCKNITPIDTSQYWVKVFTLKYHSKCYRFCEYICPNCKPVTRKRKESEVCEICQLEMANAKSAYCRNCGNSVHADCMLSWLKTNPKNLCPFCRGSSITFDKK